MKEFIFLRPFTPNIFRLTATLKPQMPPVSNANCPKLLPAPHTQTHGKVPFLCVEKEKLYWIKRSNVFNYNIIYTISMTIVTISDKIVERIFESSNGVLFWNHWKNYGPLPTIGGNQIINLMLVKTRNNVRCLTYKRGKNSSDNI